MASDDPNETLGQRIQRLRKAKGLTQEQLAEQAGVPVFSLRNWIYDARVPRVAAMLSLADALGVPLEDLVEVAPSLQRDQQEAESAALRRLKRAWAEAGDEDRRRFLECAGQRAKKPAKHEASRKRRQM